MCYVLVILCYISQSRYGLFFCKVTLNNPVDLFLIRVKRFYSSCMMWMFVSVKNALYPASHIFLVDINERCVSHARIWTSQEFWGGLC